LRSREIGIVENLAKDTLGEQVLDEHALHGVFCEVGIDGLPAKRIEVVESAKERWVPAPFFLDQVLDLLRKLRHALGEFVNRLQPLVDLRRLVGEELVDDRGQGLGARDVLVENAGPALIEDGPLWRLKDGVVGGISLVELALDFLQQVVFFVFGFPVTVGEMVEIDEPSTMTEDFARLIRYSGTRVSLGSARCPHLASKV